MRSLLLVLALVACKQEDPPDADPGTYDTGSWDDTDPADYGPCNAYVAFTEGRVSTYSTRFLDGPAFNGLDGYDSEWTVEAISDEGAVSRSLVSLTEDWVLQREEEGLCDSEGYKLVSYHDINAFREIWISYEPPLLVLPADLTLGGEWVVDTSVTYELEGEVDVFDQQWKIAVVAEDQVSFAAGTYVAARVEFQRTEDENRLIRHEWYVPDLGLLGQVGYGFSGAPSTRVDLEGVTLP